jgi:CHAT domain-containing protein
VAEIGAALQMIRDEESKPVDRRSEEALKRWAEVRSKAEDEARFVQLEMRRRSPGYASLRYPQPITLDEARALIPEGSALVHYVLGETSGIGIVLTRDAATTVVLPRTVDEITETWEKLRATLELSDTREPQADASGVAARAHELHLACLRRVLAALPAATTRLLIVSDGVLHHVPFAALVAEAPKAGKVAFRDLAHIGLTHTIAYLPSATVLAALSDAPPRDPDSRLVAFCDPLLAGQPTQPEAAVRAPEAAASRALDEWQPLAQARKEGARVAALWGGETVILEGPQAGERTAKQQLPAAGCAHFAVHGLANDESPLYSALALTSAPATTTEEEEDGLLYACEIMGLPQTPPLVVLSACETVLGAETDGEGLVGLVRAFLASDSRTVLASLWKVDDQATAALMAECYQGLRKGLRPDEALAEAQRKAARGKLPNATYAAAPCFWAAFGVYGTPAGR